MTVVEMQINGNKDSILGIDIEDCIYQLAKEGKIQSQYITVSFRKRELTKQEWLDYVRRTEVRSVQ